MHENALATKRFTRNAAQQAVKQTCINFQIFGSKILVAMQQKELRTMDEIEIISSSALLIGIWAAALVLLFLF